MGWSWPGVCKVTQQVSSRAKGEVWLSAAAWLCWPLSSTASHHTLQKEEPKQFSSWASQYLAAPGILLLPPPWLMHAAQHVRAHSGYKCCPFQMLSDRVCLISSNILFPASAPLPHTAPVPGCAVGMLGWLLTRRDRLGHLACCFQEGQQSSRAAEQGSRAGTQHAQQSQGTSHTHRAVLQRAPRSIPASVAKSKQDQSRGWRAKRSNYPHSHLHPGQSVQEGERMFRKIKVHQALNPCLHCSQVTQHWNPTRLHEPWRLWWELLELGSSLLQGNKDVLLVR